MALSILKTNFLFGTKMLDDVKNNMSCDEMIVNFINVLKKFQTTSQIAKRSQNLEEINFIH
jgi:hypothetical protein